jgi:hypothetical protein
MIDPRPCHAVADRATGSGVSAPHSGRVAAIVASVGLLARPRRLQGLAANPSGLSDPTARSTAQSIQPAQPAPAGRENLPRGAMRRQFGEASGRSVFSPGERVGRHGKIQQQELEVWPPAERDEIGVAPHVGDVGVAELHGLAQRSHRPVDP